LAKWTARQFSAALSKLVQVPSQIAPAVAKKIKRDLEYRFDAGIDPYGKPWAALRPATLAKGRHPPPLTDTHAGRESVTVVPVKDAGVQISVGVAYMGIHQAGDPPRMVARRFLPVSRLPPDWKAIWELELVRGVRKKLSR
jgi:phage gpG-like protein